MAKAIRLAIKAGQHSRQGCPVCVDLPLKVEESNSIVLRNDKGQEIFAQIVHRGDCGCRIAWILDKLAAHSEREYALEISKGAEAERVQVKDNKHGAVEVLIDGELFTTYRYLGNPARPCFFPVLGPDKARVTRSWPLSDDIAGESRDHPHHRSLWVAHGSVNGVDNWSEDPGHGYQLHRAFTRLESGPVLGIMEAKNDWTDADKKKICEETRRLTVYHQAEGRRLFDLEVTFFASEGAVKFGDTKEGGIIALRVATGMEAGSITNSYGALTEEECWGRRAQWCDYSGPVDGKVAGISIMDNFGNFRFPTYWHVRKYGMYTTNPFGLHDYSNDPTVDGRHVLPAGQVLRFKYRVYIHRGNALQAQTAERYHDFVNPPQVEVVAD
jgi:hypothetical protein